MQLKFIAALAVALLLPAGAHAQEARVVASCGTLPSAYAAGSTQYPTVDVNGKLCLQSASAPPSGTAGGDLGGTYPNPNVVSGAHLGAGTVPGTALTYGTAANTPAQGGVIIAGGPTGSATVAPVITYNAAGQLTAVTTATITPAIGSVTGLGAGVATALGNGFGTSSTTLAVGNDSRFPSVVTSAVSWTLADNSTANLTFTGVSTTYNQIGNMVWIGFQFTYPSTASTAVASIKGLPVPVANANYAKGGCVVVISATIAGGVVMIPVINTSTINFDVANLSAAVLNSALSTDTVIGSCWYPAS